MVSAPGVSGASPVGTPTEADCDHALSLFQESHAETQYLYVLPS